MESEKKVAKWLDFCCPVAGVLRLAAMCVALMVYGFKPMSATPSHPPTTGHNIDILYVVPLINKHTLTA